MGVVLSERDAARLEVMLRWFETRSMDSRTLPRIPAAQTYFQQVNVRKVGGSPGDQDTDCTFIYDVYTLDGDQRLLEGAEVVGPRPKGRLEAQSEEDVLDQIGVAFIDRKGDLQLWDAGEVPARRPCTPGSKNGG